MISKRRQAPDAVATTLLDLIVSANSADNVWSNSDFFGQCFTFFLAGHETTSSLMQWIVFELCHHPEILERLRAEVDQVLSDCEGVPYECIAKMPYLNAVLKESLRMHPPVTMVIRQAKEVRSTCCFITIFLHALLQKPTESAYHHTSDMVDIYIYIHNL